MFRLPRADNSKRQTKFASGAGLWLFLTGILGPATAIGNEINTPDKTGNTGRFTSLVLDAKGYPVISYHDLTHRDLKLLHCDNPNCAGNESGGISTVDSTGIVGTYTSLALDKNGKPVISYYDASKGKLKLLHCDSPDCARFDVSVPDASENTGKYSSLVLDDTGNPVVSYYDITNGDLKLLHCHNPGCTGDESGNISTPDSSGDVGLYTSLALDPSGNPVISYYGSKSGLRILHCNDPRCEGNESTNIAVPDKGDVGWYSALSMDAKGNPVVSYFDFSKGDLKVLHCDDPNCSGDESKNITIPDALGQVGGGLSMVLDDNGNPVISYNDATNGDLKILHCDNPKCAGDQAANIAVPDANGEVGFYTSLVLDSAGNPVVSYYDFSNGDLKLLHCANRTCKSK